MKKFTFSLFLFGLLLVASGKLQAQTQTVIYYQSFDSTYTFPTGWTTTYNDTLVTNSDSSLNGWYVDTTLGNESLGYPGASGLNNVVVKNTSNIGTYALITCNINTSLDSNIQADWGARVSNQFFNHGGQIQGFYFSTDSGATWDSIPYTEGAANSSAWILDNDSTPITLPSSANFKPAIQFKWIANITEGGGLSGTYRIDDFTVTGIVDSSHLAVDTTSKDTTSAGITVINRSIPSAYVYVSNSNINVVAKNMGDEKYTVEVIDVLGETMEKEVMTSSTMTINGSNFAAGVYLVRISNSNSCIVTKVPLTR